jgi:hypothetical protein
MKALVVITVYVAALMAGAPSGAAGQDVDPTDAIVTLKNGFVIQCKKTHTGGCINHGAINISLKRNVDSVARCLEECTQDERCEGVSFRKTNNPAFSNCILYREGCRKGLWGRYGKGSRWDYYSKRGCIVLDASFDCNVLPNSQCGLRTAFDNRELLCGFRHEKGCRGAVWGSGNPSRKFCTKSGTWYTHCCKWEYERCLPKNPTDAHPPPGPKAKPAPPKTVPTSTTTAATTTTSMMDKPAKRVCVFNWHCNSDKKCINGQCTSYTYQTPLALTGDYDSKATFSAEGTSDGKADGYRGIYSVNLPDGRVQAVSYIANDIDGFVANVKYDGTADYPEAKPYHQAPSPAPYHAPAPAYNAAPVVKVHA